MAQQIFEQNYAGTDNRVFSLDEPGIGGGCHNYRVQVLAQGENCLTEINFQKGAVSEVGINGIQHEHLIAMAIHRLQGFQSGPYACRENALALTKLEEAMHWMEARTKDRSNRNVEGTNQA